MSYLIDNTLDQKWPEVVITIVRSAELTIRRENDSETKQEAIRENIQPACFFWQAQNEHFAQNRPQYWDTAT